MFSDILISLDTFIFFLENAFLKLFKLDYISKLKDILY